MSTTEFLIIFSCCLATMLMCRCIPIFMLKGHYMPDGLQAALGFIPPAAFAALVANDLYKPCMFDAGFWPALLPFVAAAIVLVVAKKTKSLLWCAITGVISYALLLLI